MPIADHGMAEGVNDRVPSQAGLDPGIVEDELRIIVVNEVMGSNRPVYGQREDCQDQPDRQIATHSQGLSSKSTGKTTVIFEDTTGVVLSCFRGRYLVQAAAQ